MALKTIDLWNSDRTGVRGKRIEQLIGFSDEGKLLDRNITSQKWISFSQSSSRCPLIPDSGLLPELAQTDYTSESSKVS